MIRTKYVIWSDDNTQKLFDKDTIIDEYIKVYKGDKHHYRVNTKAGQIRLESTQVVEIDGKSDSDDNYTITEHQKLVNLGV